jgi:DNA polymerase (family 10)
MTNAELAQKLKDLQSFLIIAGYEESHATRYTQIARYIEKSPESVEQMRKEGRLNEIPGVGKLIQTYIKEILEDGVSSKQKEWEEFAPITVLELVRVPGLGPKTAQTLFQAHGIDSRAKLREAQEAGILEGVTGVGPKLREAIREHLAENM